MDNLTFLTGSTGLLGGHMLIQLYKKGKRLRCLIRSTSSFEQLQTICDFYEQSFEELKNNVDWVVGDTLDYCSLCEMMKHVDEVYHCAALVSFNSKDNASILRTNIQGTANMVDAALSNNIKRFCFVSSIAALGKTYDHSPIQEETPRKNEGRSSNYSESKFKSELEIWRGMAEGLNAVIVNPGIILGPGLIDKGSMLIVKTGRKGLPFYTKATTGYVDVRDVCRSSIELMERSFYGKRYILVSENAHSGTVLGLVAKEYGKKPPRYVAGPLLLSFGVFASTIWGFLTGTTPQLTKSTIRSVQNPDRFSNERLKTTLNYAFIPLDQTIKDICNHLKKQGF